MNPDLMLCRIHLDEVESQLQTLIPSLTDGDRPRVTVALSFIQQARQALSETTDSQAKMND
jgi:hypothetical protein